MGAFFLWCDTEQTSAEVYEHYKIIYSFHRQDWGIFQQAEASDEKRSCVIFCFDQKKVVVNAEETEVKKPKFFEIKEGDSIKDITSKNVKQKKTK